MLEFKLQLVNMSEWSICLRNQLGEQGVAGSLPDGDIYFYFEISLASRSSQLNTSNTYVIKHGHSHVVNVFFTRDTNNFTRPMYIYISVV